MPYFSPEKAAQLNALRTYLAKLRALKDDLTTTTQGGLKRWPPAIGQEIERVQRQIAALEIEQLQAQSPPGTFKERR